MRPQHTAQTDKIWVPLMGDQLAKPFDQTNGQVDFDVDDGDDGTGARLGKIAEAGVIAHGFMGPGR